MTITLINGYEPVDIAKEAPESATLLELAAMHAVRAFQMERIDSGGAGMCIVHFEHDGWCHIYQDGDGISSKHLFYRLLSYQDDATPQDVALSFFQGQMILSD